MHTAQAVRVTGEMVQRDALWDVGKEKEMK